MDCPISKSLVFEAQFNFPYSINFLSSLLSSQEFIIKIMHTSLCSVSINPFKLLIKQMPSSNEVIEYQVETKHKKTTLPITVAFSFYYYSSQLTLLKFSIEVIQMTMNQETYTSICKLVIENIIKEINTPLQKPIQSVSSLIKTDINTLWKLITRWEFAEIFFKDNLSNISFEGDSDKVGSIIKCDFNEYINSECVVTKSDKDPLSDTWHYFLEPILGNIEIQEVRFTLQKITDKQTFLQFENVFKENVTYESLFSLKLKKTKLIEKIQGYYSH